jgi:hypothetical protein
MTVSTDYNDDDIESRYAQNAVITNGFQRVEERIDGNTIEKTQGVATPLFSNMEMSPIHEMGEIVGPDEALRRGVEAWAERLDESQVGLLEETYFGARNVEESFMDRLFKVIGEVLARLHDSGEKRKNDLQRLELKIKTASLTAADLQQSLGWNGLGSAGLVMAASLLQFIPGCNDVDKAVANIFAKDVAPHLMDIPRHNTESRLGSMNNQLTLSNNKYNNQVNQEQSQSGQKQEITGIADKANRLFESASRAG